MSDRRKKIREHKIHARVWDAVREVWQDQRNERLEVDKLGIGIRSKVREIAADIAALEGEGEDWRESECGGCGSPAGVPCGGYCPVEGCDCPTCAGRLGPERPVQVFSDEDPQERLLRINHDTRGGTRPATLSDYLWLLDMAKRGAALIHRTPDSGDPHD